MSRPARFGAILVLVLSCTLGCNWVGPRVFRVPTGAMEPTIKAGDLVLVMLWPAENAKVGRGDIIVFRDPEKPESLYVKRAVAIGGNTVDLRGTHLRDGRQPGQLERQPFVWHAALEVRGRLGGFLMAAATS